jgi:JmjC domain, hydroxylase/PHD-zinc-finger like domain
LALPLTKLFVFRRDNLPPLDEKIKTIKVKNPIMQDFAGMSGTWRQTNVEKQKTYNLPQWKTLNEASNHQPPAKRGERRLNQDKPRTAPRSTASTTTSSTLKRKGPGRPPKSSSKTETKLDPVEPPTPQSPVKSDEIRKELPTPAKSDFAGDDVSDEELDLSKPAGRQPKASVSSRRKNNRKEANEAINEVAFEDFDYHAQNLDEYTPERCEELEKSYWKSLTYNNPLYGADMPGSLFDDSTKEWNVAKLENLLDVLSQKLPGVNTAYLYLGMWKATFAWHLEDVDLYSINYIHFGAPKQWYSISQEDARRFENAMKSVWPNDAKSCSQFLRHKNYLISPALLKSQYNITVNKLVHYEGEFVITFPYGYHSGYNIGYNCAESVNFATESWLDYGRVAKKCNCEEDSVWVDVEDIERKMRGEPTPEYEEYVEYTDDEEEDAEDEDKATDLPTPPSSVEGQPKKRVRNANPNPRKRKRDTGTDKTGTPVKRIRVVLGKQPCFLCPNDVKSEELLPTDNGLRVHRCCALYTPEVYMAPISEKSKKEMVYNMASLPKARLELKCQYCRIKKGACFQCSAKKCTRAYHATCAAAAGVLVEQREVAVFEDDGQEYVDIGLDFQCKFHRPKRAKNVDGDSLEDDALVYDYARSQEPGNVVQFQYSHGEIFAGVVIDNSKRDEVVLVDILPKGYVEVVIYR